MVQIFYEPSECNCDGTEYTRADIAAAAERALSLAKEGKTLGAHALTFLELIANGSAGKDKYPHAYHDYEHFSFAHAQAPYLEFPVLRGKTYTGEAPGADRVVLGSIAEDFQSAVYCAVITHDGQRKNNFAECKDDTMNVRGKGGEVHGHGHGHEHHVRKLVQHIELQ